MRNDSRLIGVCGGLFALLTITGAQAPRQGEVPANGIAIAYESFGSPDRQTVLLVAGTGMQLTGWPIELCQELVGKFRTVNSGVEFGVDVEPAYRVWLELTLHPLLGAAARRVSAAFHCRAQSSTHCGWRVIVSVSSR